MAAARRRVGGGVDSWAMGDGSSGPASLWRGLVALALAAAGAGCDTQNPDFCNDATECAAGQVCDLRSNTCVSLPDGMVGCADDLACGPSAPVCGDDGACRACAADAECASRLCRDDGTCAAPADLVYLAPTGDDAGPCSQDAPCRTFPHAFALVDAGSRTGIVLAAGDYGFTEDTVLDSTRDLTIAGAGRAETRLDNQGTITARGSARWRVRGLTLVTLYCLGTDAGASLELRDASLIGTSLHDNTLLASTCALSTTDVDVVANPDPAPLGEAAIRLSAASAHLVRTTVRGAASTSIGLSAVGAHAGTGAGVTIEASRFIGPGFEGLDLRQTPVRMDASSVTGFGLSALMVTGGSADVTNSVFHHNGSTVDSRRAAVWISGVSALRFEFNTVAYNLAEPGADGAGLRCDLGLSTPNNIVYGNLRGAAISSQIQGCNPAGSLVMPSSGGNDLGFVSITPPYDFHLTPTSPALGGATTSSVTVDLDGQARPGPDGAADLGADELYP